MFIQGSLLRKDDLEKSPEVFNHKLRYFLKEEKKKHPKPLKTKDNRPNQLEFLASINDDTLSGETKMQKSFSYVIPEG